MDKNFEVAVVCPATLDTDVNSNVKRIFYMKKTRIKLKETNRGAKIQILFGVYTNFVGELTACHDRVITIQVW